MPLTYDPKTFKLTDSSRPGRRAALIGFIALAANGAGFAANEPRFFHAYLTSYMFWLSIALGCLFFVMLHHLVAARWSVVVRRLSESVAVLMPLMAILFIPILFGMHNLYHWSDAAAVAHDDILQHKSPYLNVAFFIVRAVVYFGVWSVLALLLRKWSVAEDSGYDERRRVRMRRLSAGGMLLFAFTTTFAAFDWIMSLEPHWYSTIFGAYVFAGAVVGALSFMILIVLYLHRNGILTNVITVEHYNDLGKLLFAFTIFWAYMAFSQYFLIWYANIPEETIYYAHRWVGSWKTVSLYLVFGHFVIPFFLLLPKTWKRHRWFLATISIWMLVAHWVDLFWMILPGLQPQGAHISWMDPLIVIAIGGLFVGVFWRVFGAQALIPVRDPKLEGSIHSLSY